MNKRASTRFRVIVMILTAAAIAFAFIHSAMPADVSSEESAGVLDFLYNFLRAVGISAELTDHIVRKLAHFTEFTAIGMLLTTCAYSFDRFKPYRYTVYVFFAGLAAAVTDETIQLFSEGRSGQISDVLLDFSGIVLGTAVMLLLYFVYQRIRRKKMKHE